MTTAVVIDGEKSTYLPLEYEVPHGSGFVGRGVTKQNMDIQILSITSDMYQCQHRLINQWMNFTETFRITLFDCKKMWSYYGKAWSWRFIWIHPVVQKKLRPP